MKKFLVKIVLVIVFLIFSLNGRKRGPENKDTKQEPAKESNRTISNQVNGTVDTTQAPTKAENLGKYVKQDPKLSKALLEVDPTKAVTLEEFVQKIRFDYYKLTRSQVELIFAFVSIKRKNLIELQQWDDFVRLFVAPFEACDSDKNYLLDTKEFKVCFEEDFKARYIKINHEDKFDKYEELIKAVFFSKKTEINFYEYLFVKRAMFAWEQCHTEAGYIGMDHLDCAIRLLVNNKYQGKLALKNVYFVGLKYNRSTKEQKLDFLGYLRIAFYTHVFGLFANSEQGPFISKSEFKNALKESRYPNNFLAEDVDNIFNIIYTKANEENPSMDFESFVFFYHIHRYFYHYSSNNINLNITEYQKMMDDYFIFDGIIDAVNKSRTAFTEAEYQEPTVVVGRERLSEKQFMMQRSRFMQKEERRRKVRKGDAPSKEAPKEKKSNSSQLDSKIYNNTNLEILFSSMADLNKPNWTKLNSFRAFLLVNFFIDNVKDNTFRLPISNLANKMNQFYDKSFPQFSGEQRANFPFYAELPTTFHLDLLGFITIENFIYKIKNDNNSNLELISEILLKNVLKDFGISGISDSIIDLAREGFDKARRRLFKVKQVMKFVITAQVSASERTKDIEFFRERKLKSNTEKGREFLDPQRRYKNSQLA